MLLLGIDIGTSSIKVCVADSETGNIMASASYPETEAKIHVERPGWAEQSPEMWWEDVKKAILLCHNQRKYDAKDIVSIGIAYQMHGLVMIDENQQNLRNSIIWCDSRAVEIGEQAFSNLGSDYALGNLLNSPGNFTASKLFWVKQNEPDIYAKVSKVMLPGDYIAMRLTGELTTTVSALSEGIFWDFKKNQLSAPVLDYFGFDRSVIPEIRPLFSEHGRLEKSVSASLGLKPGIPVTYKSGDQPNNALSLNVMEPGQVAATAGTSGVIYGITDTLLCDKQSRVNTFAHVNHETWKRRLGVLLCINGSGSMNRWIKNLTGSLDYQAMNAAARTVPPGSNGLCLLPFGNGAERMLNNKTLGAEFSRVDLNRHTQAHMLRAVQEGIAFAFRYGIDILEENGMSPSIINAGSANLFLSDVFTQTFVNVTGVPVELYENDGSYGAAIGSGIGAGIFKSAGDAFIGKRPKKVFEPELSNIDEIYQSWKQVLISKL